MRAFPRSRTRPPILWIFTALADRLTYGLIGLDPLTGLARAVHFFVEDVTQILVLLVVIGFAVGLFRSMLTPERVRGHLRVRSHGASCGMAVGLGAVTPFCSCSSVPLFIGFLETGIPLSATMAFLIASPMINEVAVIGLASVVGWGIAVLHVLTGLMVGILAGWLTGRFRLDRYVEDYVCKIRMGRAAWVGPPCPSPICPCAGAFALPRVRCGRSWRVSGSTSSSGWGWARGCTAWFPRVSCSIMRAQTACLPR